MCMVRVGAYGWINMGLVRCVEVREAGAVLVHFTNGQDLALLPDEAAALEEALVRHTFRMGSYPSGVETR